MADLSTFCLGFLLYLSLGGSHAGICSEISDSAGLEMRSYSESASLNSMTSFLGISDFSSS